MVGVSASVNLPWHHKVHTGSPGWSRKKGRRMVVVSCGTDILDVSNCYKSYISNYCTCFCHLKNETYSYLRVYHALRTEDVKLLCVCLCVCSGEGSQYSGNSDERNLAAMARAIAVHPDTFRVMYFAWSFNPLHWARVRRRKPMATVLSSRINFAKFKAHYLAITSETHTHRRL